MMLALVAPMVVFAFQEKPSELIERLDDESIEVREQAAEALIRWGEASRAPVHEAIARTQNAEVRGRLNDVLRKLDAGKRRREFRGGNVVRGIGARLEVARDMEGEDFIVTVEITNLGPDRQTIEPMGAWNKYLPGEFHDVSNARAGITISQLSGDPPEGRKGITS